MNSESVLFISTLTLNDEPDPSEAKKWKRMSDFFNVSVICFSPEGFGIQNNFNCVFYCLPKNFPRLLRILVFYLVAPFYILHANLRRSANVWIAQSPYEAATAIFPKFISKLYNPGLLVVEAHGDWIKSFIEINNPPLKKVFRVFLNLYSSIVLKLADGIRSISSHTKYLLKNYSAKDVPHVKFPAYMDLEEFFESSHQNKKKKEQHEILYAGAITHLKGLDILLEATAELSEQFPDLTLQICGKGTKENEFRKITKELSIRDSVNFHGYVDTETLRSRMIKSKIFVLPSRTEGFGRVLVESLSCYTPFVASNTSGAQEIVEITEGGLLAPVGNAPELASQITILLEEPDKRYELGKRGHANVKSNFSEQSYFQNYKKLINKVSQKVQ